MGSLFSSCAFCSSLTRNLGCNRYMLLLFLASILHSTFLSTIGLRLKKYCQYYFIPIQSLNQLHCLLYLQINIFKKERFVYFRNTPWASADLSAIKQYTFSFYHFLDSLNILCNFLHIIAPFNPPVLIHPFGNAPGS